MKKLLTIILASLAFSGYSQEITFPEKKQPIKFNKIAFKDTVFIDTASIYNVEGYRAEVAVTADGRYFFKVVDPTDVDTITGNLVVADTIKANNAQITNLSGSGIYVSVDANGNLYKNNIDDSIAQLRLDISDTATQIRSELSDSTYFQLMGGKYLAINNIGYDSLVIGGNSKDPNAVLQVNGQFNQSFSIMSLTTDSIYNAKNGNIVMLNNDGNISKIINCAVGTIITFTCLPLVTSAILNPANFSANGQLLKTPSGSMKVFDAYDVFTIICVAPDEFLFHSESGDNQ